MRDLSEKIQVAVIEGGHPFDVPPWHQLFRSFSFIDYFPQPIENWLADWGQCRNRYGAAVFYNMNMDPADAPLSRQVHDALHEYTSTGGGVIMLHHALLAFPDNAAWIEAVGLSDRSFSYFPDQDIIVQGADPAHPVSSGISSFLLRDETYLLHDADPADGNTILFTASHEKSTGTLGWARTMNQSRVFCFQPGHDNRVWVHADFRKILAQALLWVARQ